MASPAVCSVPTNTAATSNTPTESPIATASTMPGLSQLSTASGASASSPFDLDDTYSQFEEPTYGEFSSHADTTSNNNNDKKVENQSTTESGVESSSSTFWDLFLSLYLPVLLVWMRRSMFGTMNLFRSLILGHCLRLLFGNVSEWMTEKAPWLHPLLFQQPTSNGKIDPRAWPPPALTALAILTIVALVVHPDGFTWIMLGKLRDAMLSLFHSSTTCWGIIVSDYGVIPTVAASATFAALVLLILIMYRTLSPRSKRPNRPVPSTEKKKKKRKNHMRHRGATSNSSGNANSNDTTARPRHPSTSSSSSKPIDPLPSPHWNSTATPIPPSPPPSILEETPLDLSSTHESSLPSPPMPSLDSSLPPATTTSTTTTIPRGDSSSSVMNHEESSVPPRSRVHSVSTVDTTTMSDDQSCGSTSVRSNPSMSVTSSTLGSAEKGRSSKNKHNNNRSGNKTNNSKSSNSNSRRQQHKRGGAKSSSKLERSNNHNSQTTTDVPMVASSRWDALKPSQKHDHPNSSNNINSNNHFHHNNHHRFSGRGGGRGSRKGRSSPTGGRGGASANGTNPSSAGTESFFSRAPSPAATTSAPSLTDTHTLSHPRVVSPSTSPNNLMASSSFAKDNSSKNIPPPPPGLGPLPSVGCGAMFSSSSPITRSNGNDALNLSPSIKLNLDWQNDAFSSLNAAPSQVPFSEVSSILKSQQAQQHLTATATPRWMGCPDLQLALGAGVQQKQHQPQSVLAPSPNSNKMSGGFSGPQYSPSYVKENPFAPDDDSQIEADLQELGGRMAGSILDF